MTKSTKAACLMVGVIFIMTAKILIALRLLHHWKLQALAEGRPFGDAEDRGQ